MLNWRTPFTENGRTYCSLSLVFYKILNQSVERDASQRSRSHRFWIVNFRSELQKPHDVDYKIRHRNHRKIYVEYAQQNVAPDVTKSAPLRGTLLAPQVNFTLANNYHYHTTERTHCGSYRMQRMQTKNQWFCERMSILREKSTEEN